MENLVRTLESGFILWFLQVLLPQIIIQNFCTCFCCTLGVFRIFVLDQNFQFLLGNGTTLTWGLETRHDNPISAADVGLSCHVGEFNFSLEPQDIVRSQR